MKVATYLAAALLAISLVGCGTLPAQTVARVENMTLTRKDLDERIARLQKGLSAQPAQPGQPQPSALDIEKELVERFIQQNVLLMVAHNKQVNVSEKEIDGQIDSFRTSISASGSTLEDAVQNQLGFAGPTSTEFRQFVSFFLARQKLGETLVTTDTVRKDITDQVMKEVNTKVDQVHAAHILIRVEKPEDDAAAKAKAEDVIARLAKGEKFDALAKELSQDPGSATNGGDLGWASEGQFVSEFDQAIFKDLKPGETTKTPVKTQFGYHIITVLAREMRATMTEDQAKQMIDQQVGQQLQQKRAQAVQELVDQERKKAKDDGRLVEPTYPTPTAQPAQPGQAAPPGQPQSPEQQAQPTPAAP